MNQPLVLCAILFFGSAAGRVGHTITVAAPAPAPAGGPGPAAAPGAPVETVECEFTIKNLDYDAVAEHDEARDGIRESVKTAVDGAVEAAIAGPGAPGAAPGAPPPAGPAAAPAFIELHRVNQTVNVTKPFFAKNVPQSALSHSAQQTVYRGPAASPAGAPASAPAPDNAETFVALSEGPKDNVDAQVWVVTDKANHDKVDGAMKKVCNPASLANALLGAEGIHWKHAPIVTNCKVKMGMIEPFSLDCAPHVAKIISRFSVAYTRAQVPHALEEACHLFESKMSFSGNHRITKWDKRVCKKATEKLMNTWQGGKGDKQYDDWCHDICEWKLGKGAPQCHL